MTRSLVTAEHSATRQALTTQLSGMQADAVSDREQRARSTFIESFVFPEIHFRQDHIKQAYAKTFDFMFKVQPRESREGNSFTKWLRSQDDLYWIIGKAGAGKSTLMNFLSQDTRTSNLLECQTRPCHRAR